MTRTGKIVLASSNPGKLAELRARLEPAGLHVVAQDAFGVEPPEETGLTFVENALIKARAACTATGLPALADDSGVVVHALNGAPGVRSARYAGDDASDADNVARLLEALEGVAPAERGAAFVCAIVCLRHARDPCPIVCEGVWEGRILDAPRGGGGFGYDPVFFIEALGRTAAELSFAEKNAVSHRGQALAQLIERLARDRIVEGFGNPRGADGRWPGALIAATPVAGSPTTARRSPRATGSGTMR